MKGSPKIDLSGTNPFYPFRKAQPLKGGVKFLKKDYHDIPLDTAKIFMIFHAIRQVWFVQLA